MAHAVAPPCTRRGCARSATQSPCSLLRPDDSLRGAISDLVRHTARVLDAGRGSSAPTIRGSVRRCFLVLTGASVHLGSVCTHPCAQQPWCSAAAIALAVRRGMVPRYRGIRAHGVLLTYPFHLSALPFISHCGRRWHLVRGHAHRRHNHPHLHHTTLPPPCPRFPSSH